MDLISTIIVAILEFTLCIGCFGLGWYAKGKKKETDGLVVSENNKDFIDEMMRWRSYNGK